MKEVNAAILTIGDELLIGQTIDTNSAFIGRELNRIGIWIKRRIAIGDVKEDILDALREQSKDCDIIIITGGLGPTADDVTKPALCEYFGSTLIVDENVLQHVKNIFTSLNRPLIERNLKQAEVPHNCIVLHNARGTAPGMWFEGKPVCISLPGVPHEMKGLITDVVIPRLREHFELPSIEHRTLLTSGIGESMLAEAIADFENALPPQVRLAYLPAHGLVRLRLTCKHPVREEAVRMVDRYFSELRELVTQWMVADSDATMAEALSQLLRKKGKTVATAESCTGGYIAHLLTSHAGSSAIYDGSVVAYANSVKENLLGVSPATLEKYGAVSEEAVKEMVNGALQQLKTDYVIATSGIMGPDGGTPEKPVGTVWIAVGSRHCIKTHKAFFRFDRIYNIELTAHTALSMLYRLVKEGDGE